MDPLLGVIFEEKPKDCDDLTMIKGVAAVVEAKLHASGVYTFEQIAKWDPRKQEIFGEKLSFKDRIARDEWRAQCRKLYEEKYGKPLD